MELSYFKDKLFDLLNDCDNMDISDIDVNEAVDTITISMADGSAFEITCRQVIEEI